MKRLVPAFLLSSVLLIACKKNGSERERPVDLEIVEAGVPDGGVQNSVISAHVRVAVPGSCLRFDRFDIRSGPGAFEIRAKGIHNGQNICADILGLPDSTITLTAPAPGRYFLHFYNKDVLFATDTVQVN